MISCKSSYDKDTIKLGAKSNYKLSEIFDNIDYLTLSEPDVDFGMVDKVELFRDSLIILADFYQTQSILIYNKDGEFLHAIDRNGAGPTEYRAMNDFSVNAFEHSIEILNEFNQIKGYDFQGNYKYTITLPYHAEKFLRINEDKLILFTPATDNFVSAKCDVNGCYLKDHEVVKSYCIGNSEINNFMFAEKKVFAEENGVVYFTTSLSNIIYTLKDNNTLNSEFYLDFGRLSDQNSKLISEVNSDNFNADHLFDLLNSNSIPYHSSSLLVKDSIIVSMVQGPQHMFGFFFYSMEQNELLGQGKPINDLDGGLTYFSFIGSYESGFVSLVNPNLIVDWKLENDRSSKPFNQFAKTIQDDHYMPVLAFFDLK